MVPKVAGKGSSFKGAGLYYLHDKREEGERERLTSERVAFTRTENLPTDDPEKALGWMAYTALNQAYLKQASGQAKTGRKLTSPVYTYSLSWHPDQDPTREQMLSAAAETIKALGLDGHETLLIAHNDEPHQHIHIIVNRVHPHTGIAAKLSNDRLVLSKWAEEYERRTGQILCRARVSNNAARERGQFVKDNKSLTKADYLRAQRDRETAKALEQAKRHDLHKSLAEIHHQQREALRLTREQKIRTAREQVREQHRPQWRKLYQRQRADRAKLFEVRDAAQERLRYWLNNKNIDRYGGSRETRAGHLSKAWNAIDKTAAHKASLKAAHDKERRLLGAKQRKEVREQLKQVREGYSNDLDRLKKAQERERALPSIQPPTTRAQGLRENIADITRAPVAEKQPRAQALRENAADITKEDIAKTRARAAKLAPPKTRTQELRENKEDITKDRKTPGKVEQQPQIPKLSHEELRQRFLRTAADITTPASQRTHASDLARQFAKAAQLREQKEITNVTPGVEAPAREEPTSQTPKLSHDELRQRFLSTASDITKPAPEKTPDSDLRRQFAEAAQPPEHEEQTKSKGGGKKPSREEEHEEQKSGPAQEFREAAEEITKPVSERDALAEARRRRDDLERLQRERDEQKRSRPGFDPDRGH